MKRLARRSICRWSCSLAYKAKDNRVPNQPSYSTIALLARGKSGDSVTVESLIRPRFQRWLRDTLMQCEKSQRKRIIIKTAEADVGQHISRLQPVIRLVNALGVRVAVNQAGLTLVSTSSIKELNVELLKLHPGLVRNIEKRTENQAAGSKPGGSLLRDQHPGLRHRRAFAKRVADPDSARCYRRARDFFASSQPLDNNVKNIHKDTRFNLPFNPFSRRITRAASHGDAACSPDCCSTYADE